jgi:hypothetical protein
MGTERWIILFAVASFFAGVFFGQSASQVIIDNTVSRERDYEKAWDSLEQRDAEWSAAFRKRTPDLPPRYEPFGGQERCD